MASTKPNGKSTTTRATGNSKKTATSGIGKGNSQLQAFFIDALKDIYWAEKHLVKALPKMQKAATTPELKEAIGEHIAQTEGQVGRLEEIFELLEVKAQAKKCDAMEGLIKEGESIVEDTESGSMTRDTGIIMAAQKIEHYEIATYGGLLQLATVMGEDEIANLLKQTLEEEKETDTGLTEIAENSVNWKAEQEDEENEEEAE